MKPLTLALALSFAISAPTCAFAQSHAAAPAAEQAPKSTPVWVGTSNRYAQILLRAQLRFQPESASFFGIPGYDDKVADLGRAILRVSARPPPTQKPRCRKNCGWSAIPMCARTWKS